jgi:Leucine-rich repeat (LRR) protein/GTPase SAR1 family protein
MRLGKHNQERVEARTVSISGDMFGQNNPQPILEDLLTQIREASTQQSKQQLLKELIEIPSIKKLERLDLSELGLTELPPQIGKLTNLTVLRLSYNQITVIPETIGNLTNLTELWLDRNQITLIPETIGNLTNLTVLKLDRNQITLIPETIDNLTNLTELRLDRNQITVIPEVIGNLTNLTILRLDRNQITLIPEAIGNLTNLTVLWLDRNQITVIPEAISNLTNLIVLRLDRNTPQPTLEVLLTQIKQASNQQSQQHLLKQLIEIAANQKLQKLNLSQLGLTELPPQIGKLTNLTELWLDRNQITLIPETIGKLTNLTELRLDSNQITVIPEAIGKLTNLTGLWLNENQITHIPETIDNLTNLTELWLDRNQITHIPEAIGKLTNLTGLRLDNNKITVIPETIGKLTSLTGLWLHSNQITVIPEAIGNLTNLTALWLFSNQITVIPETIGNLTNLTVLALKNNQIASLPQSLKSLQKLKRLDLKENPIPIPPEILAGNAQSILSFYFQTQDGETEIIYEAKFIIVGEGGAGKTTLAKKLQDSKHVINPEQESTEGIEIIPWKFSLPDGTLFRVNIWDFGGQEIYHATHQFFLTERSLYTLVVDNRRENPNLYYWLNVVRLLSNNSPIFILKNEKGDRQCEFNEGELRGEFDNLERSVAANLANNKKLKDIDQAIRTHITKLPHLDIPIPKTWSKIRTELENYARQNRNYISIDAYYTLCETYGFRERRQMLEISKYFHDLGICLHFQTETLLKRQLILVTVPRDGNPMDLSQNRAKEE